MVDMKTEDVKQEFPVPKESSERESHLDFTTPGSYPKQDMEAEGHTTNAQPAGGRDVKVSDEKEEHTTFTQP